MTAKSDIATSSSMSVKARRRVMNLRPSRLFPPFLLSRKDPSGKVHAIILWRGTVRPRDLYGNAFAAQAFSATAFFRALLSFLFHKQGHLRIP